MKRIFFDLYKKNLVQMRKEKPGLYCWPIEELNSIHLKMCEAMINGSFNKDSDAIKATCKELGLKHTYKSIKEYIK